MVARNVPEDDGVVRLTSPQAWGNEADHLLPSSAASAPPTSSNVARAVGGFHEFARAPLFSGAARATRDGLQQPPPSLASGSTARNANWQPPQPLQSSFAQRPPACQHGSGVSPASVARSLRVSRVHGAASPAASIPGSTVVGSAPARLRARVPATSAVSPPLRATGDTLDKQNKTFDARAPPIGSYDGSGVSSPRPLSRERDEGSRGVASAEPAPRVPAVVGARAGGV